MIITDQLGRRRRAVADQSQDAGRKERKSERERAGSARHGGIRAGVGTKVVDWEKVDAQVCIGKVVDAPQIKL